ncbi:aldo/keto reductase [Sphingomonas sp. OK281]|uniref:aldo/keto reductase n=1 Tax=Sphingomonas sp. OK281 TaxID=1881067 RepID=UPI0008EBAD6A|nr:aldo/keto reductase [Sphingomonas sp. OK281]SFN70746.1 D-threo-aldose 1-dehydrogenase [Sphingomonas sp. OK281]
MIATRRLGKTETHVTRVGFGAATFGNLYQAIDDGAAREAVDVAFDAGIRYFDTAPFYGYGLSERRLGDALRARRDVVVSSKVGRRLIADQTLGATAMRDGFAAPLPFRVVYDYSYDGILRSHEDSLQRLGLARIDLLLVHDIGWTTHGETNARYWDQLTRGGGFRALEHLRDSRAIGGFGLGVNETAVCLDAMRVVQLDMILLAGRYTLLEQDALDAFLPACEANAVSVVIGGPYNSGILATGTMGEGPLHYNYDSAPTAIVDRVRRIEVIAEAHRIPLAAAALQFPLAHPAVACVLPGLTSHAQAERTMQLYRWAIPDAFWADLRQAGLLRADASVGVVRGVEAIDHYERADGGQDR